MALRTPPSWLQNGSHPAENDRLTQQAIYASTGIITPTSLAVTQSGTPAMSVVVSAGWGAVVGDYQPNMGAYVVYNDASVTLPVTTADPTNPRIDLVCVTVEDSYYSGSADTVILQVVAGTPASSPSAPAAPANSLPLAQIAVGAGVTSIVNANITDVRVPIQTNLPVGDITGVTAGNGLSGGGTSGSVSLSINTAITADLSTSQTVANKALNSTREITTVSPTAATGTINYNAKTQNVLFYTTNSTGNFTLNVRGDSGTTLNSIMAVGDAMTIVFLQQNGATAYYLTGITIDGNAQTIKWQGGTPPTSGNVNAIDTYSFCIIKTAAAPTYTVLGSIVRFE